MINMDVPHLEAKTMQISTTLNAHNMVLSSIPNEPKKCMCHGLSRTAAAKNVGHVQQLMRAVGYLPTWWTPLVRKGVGAIRSHVKGAHPVEGG